MADAVVKVTLPEMGESVTEGSIVEWRKRVGDQVNEGDTLVDVTTDKVDVEVPATAAGTITQLFGKEGDTIAVGADIGGDRHVEKRRREVRSNKRRAARSKRAAHRCR